METIVIVGAGIMGENIAKLCLENHKITHLVDISKSTLDRARQSILSQAKTNTDNLFCHHDFPKLNQRVLVIEAVTENLKIKAQVFNTIENNVTENSIIVTNTSGLSIDELALLIHQPNRFIGVHFFNPADLIPGVEVILHDKAPQALAEEVKTFLIELKKIPAQVNRSIPGFVVNRIQHALMRECFYLIEQGIIHPSDLDTLIKSTLGIRLAVNGPFIQRDFNGLDTHLSIAEYLYPTLCNDVEPPNLLKQLVVEDKLGVKNLQGFYAWNDMKIYNEKRREKEQLQKLQQLLYT